MMKDFLVRILVGAVVSSIVSAGILYFAFDQSLRGVEAALQVQSTSVAETGQWVRAVDGKVDTLSTKIDGRFDMLAEKLDEISSAARDNNSTYTFDRMRLMQDLVVLQGEFAKSLETTYSVANILSSSVDPTSVEFGELTALIAQIKAHEDAISRLNFDVRYIKVTDPANP